LRFLFLLSALMAGWFLREFQEKPLLPFHFLQGWFENDDSGQKEIPDFRHEGEIAGHFQK